MKPELSDIRCAGCVPNCGSEVNYGSQSGANLGRESHGWQQAVIAIRKYIATQEIVHIRLIRSQFVCVRFLSEDDR
jgi:hypothetical protein